MPENLDLDCCAERACISDRWILAEFSLLLQEVQGFYRKFDIFSASRAMKNFGTNLLSGHWMVLAKHKLDAGDLSSTWTLHRIWRDWLTIFSPVCPMFAHYLGETIYHISAMDIREFPRPPIEDCAEADRLRSLTRPLCEFNGAVWQAKQDKGLHRGAEIAGVCIPDCIAEFTPELSKMHRLT